MAAGCVAFRLGAPRRVKQQRPRYTARIRSPVRNFATTTLLQAPCTDQALSLQSMPSSLK